MEGTPFGRYQLIEMLGRGGMGEVWRAYDTATQRIVAVKVLPENLANDPEFEERFRREAYAAAGLTDPHVVPIHNFGEIDGRLYVDMRLIKGADLQAILSRGRLDPHRAVKIIEQVASALDEAHRIKLVHRDVKPSNILVADHDFAYLIDFGIARAAGDSGITGTNNVIGTWAYLAPERMTGRQFDARVDIYALACVLHEALTGRQPFPGASIEQQISGHLTQPPPRPSTLRGDLPPQIDAVIAKGMAKNPDHRFSSVVEMADAAREAVTVPSRQVKPMRPAPPPLPPMPRPPQPQPQPQPWPPVAAGPPTPPGPPKSRTGIYALVGAVALLAIVAVVAVIALTRGSSDDTGAAGGTTGETTAAADETGPFTGTYTVEYGAPTTLQDVPNGNAAPPKERWAVLSSCSDSGGCVASAVLAGDNTPLVAPIFDEVDGTWLAVNTVSGGTCFEATADYWVAAELQPEAGGDFSGTVEVLYPARCAQKYTITLTRTGDLDPDAQISDPADESPRVASPAEGLYGEYTHTRTYTKNGAATVTDYRVKTRCLRTGDRCISYFDTPESGLPLVFSDNQWTTDLDWEYPCEAGGTSQVALRADYPMPSNPGNPIETLTGTGDLTFTGTTCAGGAISERFERIGD